MKVIYIGERCNDRGGRKKTRITPGDQSKCRTLHAEFECCNTVVELSFSSLLLLGWSTTGSGSVHQGWQAIQSDTMARRASNATEVSFQLKDVIDNKGASVYTPNILGEASENSDIAPWLDVPVCGSSFTILL